MRPRRSKSIIVTDVPQKQVIDASNILFGSPSLYTSSSASFYNHFNIEPGTAAILAIKDYDSTAPAAVYTLTQPIVTHEERQALVNWVRPLLAFCHYVELALILPSLTS